MQTNEKTTKNRLFRMVGVALFCALAYVAMLLIHFPVSFLTLDPKDAIITLCGLCFGPISALVSSLVVALLEMVTVSSTGPYGLLMNFAGTAAFSVTVALLYKWRKNLSGAILGLVSGIAAMTAVMLALNLLVTPRYLHVDVSVVRDMIPTLLLPFNLVKATFNASLVLLLYKPVSAALQRVGFLPKSDAKLRFGTRTILVTIAALILIAASLVVIFKVLGGSFKFGV